MSIIDNKCMALLCILLVLLISPRDTLAGAEAKGTGIVDYEVSEPDVQGRLNYQIPLSKIATSPGPLRLVDAASGIDLFLPLSRRFSLDGSVLTLKFVNSAALARTRSVLSVLINDITVGQVELRADRPEATVRLTIPQDVFRVGFNKLSLRAVQHVEATCEDPEAPELWTEIDTSRSFLSLSGKLDEAPSGLAELDAVFGPGVGAARSIDLLTPQSEGREEAFDAAALVVQGLALRADYETLEVRTRGVLDAPLARRDPSAVEVVVGEAARLRATSVEGVPDVVDGATLSMVMVRGDAKENRPFPRLIVTGNSKDDLLLAARALSVLDSPFATGSTLAIKGIDLPPAAQSRALGAPQYVFPGETYSFRELGQKTTTLFGGGVQRINLPLRLPPDLYADENARVEISFDMAYGPGVGPGSVVSLYVNGIFSQGILLDSVEGGVFQGYRMQFPLRRLKAGLNTVSVEVSMKPQSVPGECAGIKGRHLRATIFGTSTVKIPQAEHVTAQPNLTLFGETGYPYYRPDGKSPTTLVVSSSALVGSALTVAGKIAQSGRGPVEEINVVISDGAVALDLPTKGNVLVVAPISQLPLGLFDEVAHAIGQTSRLPYRILQGIAHISAGTFEDAIEGSGNFDYRGGFVRQVSELGELGLMTALISPQDRNATVTVITGTTEDTVKAAVGRLVRPEIWSRIDGGIMAWGDTPESVTSLSVGTVRQVGSASWWQHLRFYLSRNPEVLWGGSVIALVLLGLVSLRLLRRRRDRVEEK